MAKSNGGVQLTAKSDGGIQFKIKNENHGYFGFFRYCH
jgi:hypothetical protein